MLRTVRLQQFFSIGHSVADHKEDGMNAKFILILGVSIALISGCAVTKEWSATGGSRSDGVVRLSYEVAEMEKPQLSEQQAIRLASQRCRTWGYTGAEAFGGATRKCRSEERRVRKEC